MNEPSSEQLVDPIHQFTPEPHPDIGVVAGLKSFEGQSRDVPPPRRLPPELRSAVVVSNDSDLAEPVRTAQSEAGVKVGVINPHPAKYRSRRLQGTFFKQLRVNVLGQCQLPRVVHDADGPITKPNSW